MRSVHRRCVRDSDKEAFGAEEAQDGLAPGLLAGTAEDADAPGLKLCGRCSDCIGALDVELDAALGHRKVRRPLSRAEAGLGGVFEGPEAEVLDAIDSLVLMYSSSACSGRPRASR